MENQTENIETEVPVQEPEIDYSEVEIEGLPELNEGESYKGMMPIQEYAKLAPDIGKHFKNLQGAKTRAEQRAAQLEKELAAMKAEYLGQKQATYDQIKGLEKNIYNPDGTLKQFNPRKDEEFDSYIQMQAHKAFIDANKPFVEKFQQERDAALKLETENFIDTHPEFQDASFLDAVIKKMETHPSLLLEDAYAICVRNYQQKQPEQQKFEQKVQKANQTQDNRSAIFAMGGPSRQTKTKPDISKAQSMAEIYEIYKQSGVIKEGLFK